MEREESEVREMRREVEGGTERKVEQGKGAGREVEEEKTV